MKPKLWTLPKKKDRWAAAELIHAMRLFNLWGYSTELTFDSENHINLRFWYRNHTNNVSVDHDLDIWIDDSEWGNALRQVVDVLNGRIHVFTIKDDS